MKKIVLSLFDDSGIWPLYYRYAGYRVIQVDLKNGIDIMNWNYKQFDSVHGILAAPPCTHFSGSGARWWKEKDKDGRTDEQVKLIYKTLEIINYFNPTFWALENPVGRIQKLVPELGERKLIFNPCDFGDPYTKKTCLWGMFRKPEMNYIEPIFINPGSSWLHSNLGGKSDRVKKLRSMTPPGFAKQFWLANK